MKNFKKLIATILAIITAVMFVGCNPFANTGLDNGEKINKDMSQLYVSNYNGGFGEEWLKKLKTRFEATYAGHSFEEGKTGVQIIIRSDKDGYYGSTLFNGFSSNKNEVFFTESMTYFDYLNKNYVLDISDVLKDTSVYNTLDENKDDKTILSKMTKEQVDYLTVDQKIYAVPHYLGLNGIVYDMDLFNSKKLYFAKNGVGSEDYALDKNTYGGFTGTVAYTNYKGDRSAGPDGLHGTYDDGLPATYQEFFDLCKYMAGPSKGIKPFTIAGQYSDTYLINLLTTLAADYEGLDQTMLNFNFDGQATSLATVSNGKIVKDANPTTITNNNGYELTRQAGKYYALSFVEGISSYFDAKSWNDEDSHGSAQTRYLRSSYLGEPIAFLIEGNWWENEATKVFESLAKEDEMYSKTNRKFGYLPMPKPTYEEIGDGVTLMDNNFAFCFVKKNIASSKVDLAKTFVKFCYTDYSLDEFTYVTKTPKAMNYDLSSTTIDGMTEFGRQVWNLYRGEKTETVYQYSQNEMFLANQNSLRFRYLFTHADGTGPFTDLVKNSKKATTFFNDMISYNSSSRWSKEFGKFFTTGA